MNATKREKEQALAALALLGGSAHREDDVIRGGNKLHLPEGMDWDMLIRFANLRKVEEESPTTFSRTFPYKPWDGAVALDKALGKAFGSVHHRQTPGFFGPTPPDMRTIPIDHNGGTVQVPWGPIELPILPGLWIYPEQDHDPQNGIIFGIRCEGPRKYRDHCEGIFNLVEEYLSTDSIYRGKAFDGADMPNFLDIYSIDPSKIVYSLETLTQLETSVLVRIRHGEQLRAKGIDPKSAVLLHGPFGTGKTSTAFLIAQEAIANGYTFVYAVPGRDDLEAVFRTARMYQKAVVFCEDLDAVADNSDQKSISELLDLFDGFNSKGTEVIAVLSTNYPEKIHKGMIRPGRLDALIELGAPDNAAIERLVQVYADKAILEDIDWNPVTEAMEGYLPAYVREATQRAIAKSILHDDGERITTEYLVEAGNSLRDQWNKQQDAPEHTPADTLGTALQGIVGEEARQAVIHNVAPDCLNRDARKEALGA